MKIFAVFNVACIVVISKAFVHKTLITDGLDDLDALSLEIQIMHDYLKY